MSNPAELSVPIDFNARTEDGHARVLLRRLPTDVAAGTEVVAFDPEEPELRVRAHVARIDTERGVAYLDLAWETLTRGSGEFRPDFWLDPEYVLFVTASSAGGSFSVGSANHALKVSKSSNAHAKELTPA